MMIVSGGQQRERHCFHYPRVTVLFSMENPKDAYKARCGNPPLVSSAVTVPGIASQTLHGRLHGHQESLLAASGNTRQSQGRAKPTGIPSLSEPSTSAGPIGTPSPDEQWTQHSLSPPRSRFQEDRTGLDGSQAARLWEEPRGVPPGANSYYPTCRVPSSHT